MNSLAHRRFIALIFVCASLSGCSLLPERQRELVTPAYRSDNVFAGAPSLPPDVKLVAVLPLDCDPQNADLAAGTELLDSILRGELAKTRKFQVCSFSAEWLRLRTGQDHWSDDQSLPPKLFDWLRDDSGCDAVLFCHLTVFRAFAPLAVGLRLRLVDARTQVTLWSADEVFDAGQPAVRAGARRFQSAELEANGGTPDEWLVTNSPRQFGQYAAAQLLATLPRR